MPRMKTELTAEDIDVGKNPFFLTYLLFIQYYVRPSPLVGESRFERYIYIYEHVYICNLKYKNTKHWIHWTDSNHHQNL